MGYCILSLKKYHTFPQLNALQKHNERQLSLPNVDHSMSVHNVTLYFRGMSYTDAWHEIVKEEELNWNRKITVRKNAVIAIEIVTGFSGGTDINIKQWAEKTQQWLENKFGKEHIIASTLHLDETAPHIHTEIVPIDDRGHLCAKSFTGGRMAMANLHTEYAKEMVEFGLSRGEKASKAKKNELNAFYKAVNKAKNATLPPRMNDESEEEYIKRMEEYCKIMKSGFLKLELELQSSNALIGTRIAQEFSRYSHAVSLYEDLYDKFNGDELLVNHRLTTYRKIENRTPNDTLSKLLINLQKEFEDKQTPLTNWAEKGKNALMLVKNEPLDTDTYSNSSVSFSPLEYEEYGYKDNDDSSGMLDI